jgi:hypothetical protein
MLLCKTCDAEVQPGQTFCVNCGARTEGNTYSVSDAPSAPAVPGSAPVAPYTAPDLGVPPPLPVAPAQPPYAPSLPASGMPPATAQQPGAPGVPYAPPVSEGETSTGAVLSLVFGLLGLFFFLPVIGSIVAVVAGHIARRNIRESNGRLKGDGLALAGLITGYIGIGLVLIGCALVLLFGVLAALGEGVAP